MTQRVQITIDLGAGAPIEVIRQLIDDVDTVCQFGGEIQYQVALAEAQEAVLSNPQPWFFPGSDPSDAEWWSSIKAGGGVPTPQSTPGQPVDGPLNALFALSPNLPTAVSRYMDANDSTQDTITRVESIRYENPIDIVITVGTATFVALGMLASNLVVVARGWSARRRMDAATASVYETRAAEYRSVHLARKQLRDHYVRRVIEEDIRLPTSVISDLLTLDVAGAMTDLEESNFTMRELGSGSDDESTDE